MTKIWILIFMLLALIGCTVVGEENMNRNEIIEFVNTHIGKIVKKDFLAAYQDYYSGVRATIGAEQFKDTFEKQLDKFYGQLKNAEFKDISFGKRITVRKIFNTATLFYKAEIDKLNTFIRIEVIKEDSGFYLLSYQYINFAMNIVPPELK